MHLPSNLEELRKQYPQGTLLELVEMDDPFGKLPAGSIMTVDFVDDAGQIHGRWNTGGTLALIPGIDKFSVVKSLNARQALQLLPKLAKMSPEEVATYCADRNIHFAYDVALSTKNETFVRIIIEENCWKAGFGTDSYSRVDDPLHLDKLTQEELTILHNVIDVWGAEGFAVN